MDHARLTGRTLASSVTDKKPRALIKATERGTAGFKDPICVSLTTSIESERVSGDMLIRDFLDALVLLLLLGESLMHLGLLCGVEDASVRCVRRVKEMTRDGKESILYESLGVSVMPRIDSQDASA